MAAVTSPSVEPLALVTLTAVLSGGGGLATLDGRSQPRLWHDGLQQSDILVKAGDLTLPPRALSGVVPRLELSEALARHIEDSIPPVGSAP